MSKEGFVQCFRKFADWEWYTDSYTFHLFFHCIISANHKDNYYRGVLIKRGQFRTGRKKLSIETGLSEQQIRTCLRRLKSTNEITIVTNTQYSIITVNNYDKYQGIFTKSTSDLTNEQPTSNQRLTTNNNDNNENNDNNSLSHAKKITREEREILKNYVERKKLAKSSVTAYINTMIRNGDHIEILEKEKKRLQAVEEKKAGETEQKVNEVIPPADAEEEKQRIEQIQKEIRAKRRRRQ